MHNLVVSQPQCLPPRGRISNEIRFLCQTRNSRAMSRFLPLIIPTGIMDRNAIIPQCARLRRPLEPHLDVNIILIHIIQIVQNHIAFGFVESNDLFGHGPVHEE